MKRLDATFAVAPRGHGAEEFHSWLKASRHPWADRLPDAIYHQHVVCEGVEAIKSVVMSSLLNTLESHPSHPSLPSHPLSRLYLFPCDYIYLKAITVTAFRSAKRSASLRVRRRCAAAPPRRRLSAAQRHDVGGPVRCRDLRDRALESSGGSNTQHNKAMQSVFVKRFFF